MNYRDKIRKAIECPQFGSARYGEWGMLNLEQRKSIKRLLDELDSAENYIVKIYKENQKLKEQLQQKEDIINKITNYCKFQIEKEQDKFPKPIESEEWLKGRISSFEEILDNKGE